jgi:hypothetical protein
MQIRPKKQRLWIGKEPVDNYESFSSISKFLNCPAAFYRQYILHEHEPTNPYLLFGEAFHETVGDILREKEIAGTARPDEVDRWTQRFETWWLMVTRDARRSNTGLQWNPTYGPETFVDRGVELVKVWLRDVEPGVDPRGVEEENVFNLTVTGCTRTVYGKLDVTTRDGGLIDWKTSTRTWNAMKEEVMLQVDLYHAGYNSLYGVWPSWAKIDIARTSGRPRIDQVPVDRSVAQVQQSIDKVVRPALQAIEKAWDTQDWPCICGYHSVEVIK